MERREFYRHPLHLPFKIEEAENADPSAAEAKDISLGGMSFVSASQKPAGSFVHLRIAIKDRSYRLKARIAYSRLEPETGVYRVGAYFADNPMSFRSMLQHLFFEVYEHHRDLRQNTDPSISEESANDRWLRENLPRFSV